MRASIGFRDIGRCAARWQRLSACAADPGAAGGTPTAAGRAPAATVSGYGDILLRKINPIFNLNSIQVQCGTVCPQTYDLRCNSGHSSDNSKQYCLVDREHGA